MAGHEKEPDWTSAPAGPGWYWYRSGSEFQMYIVQQDVDELRARSPEGRYWKSVSQMLGRWLGPIRSHHDEAEHDEAQ